MNKDEALKLALEALEWSYGGEPMPTKELEAMGAIRQVLADQKENEMTDIRKAAKMALEALEEIDRCPRGVNQATIPKAGIKSAPKQVVLSMSIGLLRLRRVQKAKEALRQALAEPPNSTTDIVEPIGEVQIEELGRPFNAAKVVVHFYNEPPPVGTKLYAAPIALYTKEQL